MLIDVPVIVITGASRGIGRATALRCAKEGVQTVLVATDADRLQKLRSEIVELGAPEPMIAAFDVADSSSIADLFAAIFKQFGRVDGLVNNAGIMRDGLLGMIKDDDIDRVLAVNVKGTIVFMQYAARLMGRRREGSIVNLASIVGTHGGSPGLTVYGASKAAVIGATRSAAKELAPKNIRVNAIAPGFIETDMTAAMKKESYDMRVAQIGIGRMGTPEEIAEVAWFLLSPASSYVSGQIIGVDGQMVM